jgi:hypothetical protein
MWDGQTTVNQAPLAANASRPAEVRAGHDVQGVETRAAADRPALDLLRRASPRFYVCFSILLLSAFTLQGLAAALNLYLRKAPVPLRAPLYAMDQTKLAPEFELHPIQPEPLPHEAVSALGTEEYLQWDLVDVSLPSSDPVRSPHVFITYYTGQPDPVPHTPDNCIATSGWRIVSSRTELVPVPGAGAPDDLVPVRVLEAEPPVPPRAGVLGADQELPRRTVLYFFHVNGRYRTQRDEVRWVQANLLERYAYYAKIEISFTDGARRQFASREQSLSALPRLLGKLLPILLNDHFADWEQLNAQR